MIDFRELEKIERQKMAEYRQVLKDNDLEFERDASYIFWSKMDIVSMKYDKLVINEFNLDVNFDIFKKSLKAFKETEFIYYNQSSIDTRVIVNFLEHGFGIIGTKTFNHSLINDKPERKTGLLISIIK